MQKSGYHPETQLYGNYLVLARLAWIVLVVTILVACTVAFFEILSAPVTICSSGCTMTPGEAMAWSAAGFDPAFENRLTNVVWGLVVSLGFLMTAAVIAWRKSDDWLALLVSFALIGLGPYLLGGVNVRLSTIQAWQPITLLLLASTILSFTALFFVFPDGHFVPGWTRWLYTVFAIIFVSATLYDLSQALVGSYQGGISSTLADVLQILGAFVMFLVGASSQVFRYYRFSDATQRLQIKWIVFGLLGPVLTIALWMLVFTRIETFGSWILAVGLITQPLAVILALAWPVSVGFSILRYRLFDIDVIIRRTLIYAALTASLAAVYFGTVLALQAILRTLTGQNSDLTIVASTLLIAALFAPFRNRVQQLIDRRLYRQRYDTARVLHNFGATVRDEVDIDRLKQELLTVVDQTMQPASASLWLRSSPGPRIERQTE